MPEVLQSRCWDNAEKVELHLWAQEVMRRRPDFADIEHLEKPFEKLLPSLVDMGYVITYRVRIRAKRLEQLVLDAQTLSDFLWCASQLDIITILRRDLQDSIAKIERHKNYLYSKLDEYRKASDNSTAQFARLHLAIEKVRKEHDEYIAAVGQALEHNIILHSNITCAFDR